MTDTAQERTQATYLQKDLDQIAGTPDGELVFVDLMGFEVPSFIDPRYDLITPGQVKRIQRLKHHVPFSMRGDFFVAQLPDPSLWDGETDEEKYCVCMGKKKDGLPCRKRAQNRSQFCGLHGGALHPADRKLSNLPDGIIPEPSKIVKMTRAQRVMAGIVPIEELGDDEITGLFVWDDDGRKVSSRKLTNKIHGQMVQEMSLRINDRMLGKVNMTLDVVEEIMNDTFAEAGDRLKAAVWYHERTMGKTPEVIIHGKTDTPYEQIFSGLQTTSRDEYRRALESGNIIEGEVIPDGDLGPDSHSAYDGPEHSNDPAGTIQQHSSDSSDDSGVPVHFEDVDIDGDSQLSEKAQAAVEQERVDKRLARIAQVERTKRLALERTRQKNRRYAARMTGAKNTADLPWLVDYRPFGNAGHHYAKLVSPDNQTEEVFAKISAAEQIAASITARP